MKILLVLLALSTALLAAQDARLEEIGKSPVEAKFVAGGKVHMRLCPSGMEVIGRDDALLRVSYPADRGDVKVRIAVSGDRADIHVTGCPHGNFQARIEIPNSSAV